MTLLQDVMADFFFVSEFVFSRCLKKKRCPGKIAPRIRARTRTRIRNSIVKGWSAVLMTKGSENSEKVKRVLLASFIYFLKKINEYP